MSREQAARTLCAFAHTTCACDDPRVVEAAHSRALRNHPEDVDAIDAAYAVLRDEVLA